MPRSRYTPASIGLPSVAAPMTKVTGSRTVASSALLCACCALCALLCLSPPRARAESVTWLYDVSVEIPDRSSEARAAASREGLATVLTRLTGLAQLPQSPTLEAALAAPDRYALRFGYREAKRNDKPIVQLAVRYADAALQKLVKDSALPLWSANRPKLLVWVARDAASRQTMRAPDATDPVDDALSSRATFRGLPIALPPADGAPDAIALSDALQRTDPASLHDIAQRAQADGMLVGRIVASPSGRAHGQWRMALFGADERFELDAATPEEAAALAIDRATDEIVGQYAIAAGEEREMRMRVDGISDFAQYSALLRYLGSLEFVEQLRVVEVERGALHVSITTNTPWDRFAKLLALDGRLQSTMSLPDPSSEIDFAWHGQSTAHAGGAGG